jgi:membrane-associated protein
MPEILDMILHIDKTLGLWVDQYGSWVYLALFLIVFAETGLVVAPFLPGDSLLFISGAFCANGAMNLPLLIALLLAAAILGNTVNYHIGRVLGQRAFTLNVRFLDRAALLRTQIFYERHGGKALVLCRFLPVLRTFAPFVAGAASMNPPRFQLFNVGGALLWVLSMTGGGYLFGNIPFIRNHLNTIVLAGLAAAIVPVTLGVAVKMLRR